MVCRQLPAYTKRFEIWLIDRNFRVQISISEALYSYRLFAHVSMTLMRFRVFWKGTRYMTQLFASTWTNKIYRIVEDINRMSPVLCWSRALADATVLIRGTPRIHLSVSPDNLVRMLPTHSAIFIMTLWRLSNHGLTSLESTR